MISSANSGPANGNGSSSNSSNNYAMSSELRRILRPGNHGHHTGAAAGNSASNVMAASTSSNGSSSNGGNNVTATAAAVNHQNALIMHKRLQLNKAASNNNYGAVSGASSSGRHSLTMSAASSSTGGSGGKNAVPEGASVIGGHVLYHGNIFRHGMFARDGKREEEEERIRLSNARKAAALAQAASNTGGGATSNSNGTLGASSSSNSNNSDNRSSSASASGSTGSTSANANANNANNNINGISNSAAPIDSTGSAGVGDHSGGTANSNTSPLTGGSNSNLSADEGNSSSPNGNNASSSNEPNGKGSEPTSARKQSISQLSGGKGSKGSPLQLRDSENTFVKDSLLNLTSNSPHPLLNNPLAQQLHDIDDEKLSGAYYLITRNKILVRNEYGFVSMHPRDVAIEKTNRMRAVVSNGFLSSSHSAYKALGEPVLDAEQLILDTLYPIPSDDSSSDNENNDNETERDDSNNNSSSRGGSSSRRKSRHHRPSSQSQSNNSNNGNANSTSSNTEKSTRQGNISTPKNQNGINSNESGKPTSSIINNSTVNNRRSNITTSSSLNSRNNSIFGRKRYNRLDNGYRIIKEKLHESNSKIRALKLGASYFDSVHDNEGLDLKTSESDEMLEGPDGFYSSPVVDYRNWHFDREKQESYYRTHGNYEQWALESRASSRVVTFNSNATANNNNNGNINNANAASLNNGSSDPNNEKNGNSPDHPSASNDPTDKNKDAKNNPGNNPSNNANNSIMPNNQPQISLAALGISTQKRKKMIGSASSSSSKGGGGGSGQDANGNGGGTGTSGSKSSRSAPRSGSIFHSNKLVHKMILQRDSFYKLRGRQANSINKQIEGAEAEMVQNFTRKFVSFRVGKHADFRDDLQRMRDKARQIKVQEKLRQMSDITWYEEFLNMLPAELINEEPLLTNASNSGGGANANGAPGASNVNSNANGGNSNALPLQSTMAISKSMRVANVDISVEERLLKRIKSFIETDTPFNKNTFTTLVKCISSDEFQRESIQKLFRFLKTYAFRLSERDYLGILEDNGFEEVRVIHNATAGGGQNILSQTAQQQQNQQQLLMALNSAPGSAGSKRPTSANSSSNKNNNRPSSQNSMRANVGSPSPASDALPPIIQGTPSTPKGTRFAV